jgi:hypothetical protein
MGKKIIVDLRAAAQGKAYTENSARRRTLLLHEVFLGGFIQEVTLIGLPRAAMSAAVGAE